MSGKEPKMEETRMEDWFALLSERKSVRMFEPKPVEEGTKNVLIEAALQAPTAGNQTLYTILDIEDQELKEKLAVLCDDQPFIAKAPVVFVFLADCSRWMELYRAAGLDCRLPGPGDFMLACSDALIAAQNTVVAAQAMGLGSCYIGDVMERKEEMEKLLKLESYLFPAAMLVYGYPTQGQKERKKPERFPARMIVQKNTYSPWKRDELQAMFEERHKDQPGFCFNSYIEAFCKRKYESDFSKEMSRSAGEYWKQYK